MFYLKILDAPKFHKLRAPNGNVLDHLAIGAGPITTVAPLDFCRKPKDVLVSIHDTFK